LILIKELLFKLLDEIEPNDLLEVRMDKQYMNLLLANKKSILPLAIEMRPCRDNDEDLEEVYRQAFCYDEISEYEEQYISEHTILLNERKYVVVEELIDIEYADDYFAITTANPNGISTNYFQYSNISSIRVAHELKNSAVKQYNALNYKFKSNK
jgi:hypothetical protein